MEDDLHFLSMENDLNCFINGKQPNVLLSMRDDDLICFANERQPQMCLEDDLKFICKRKTTSILSDRKMLNGRLSELAG